MEEGNGISLCELLCSTCWKLFITGKFSSHHGLGSSPRSTPLSCPRFLSAVQPPPLGKTCAIYRVFSLDSLVLTWCCFLFRNTFISSYLCNPISFLSNLMILLSLSSLFRFLKNLSWNSGKETLVDVMVLPMSLVFSFLFFFFFSFSFQVHLTAAKPVPPTLEARSLNHWTYREVPFLSLFKVVYDWRCSEISSLYSL